MKMNRKSINRNVWVLTLSLCLGIIGYATLSAQVANPQKADPVVRQPGTDLVRQPRIDLGGLASPTATQLERIKQIPYFKSITTQAPAGRVGGATATPSVDYVVTCGELTLDCGNLNLDPCLKAAEAACATQKGNRFIPGNAVFNNQNYSTSGLLAPGASPSPTPR